MKRTAIEALDAIEAREQAAFEADIAAYKQVELSIDAREAEAYRLDTNFTDTGPLHTPGLGFLRANWSDEISELEMLTHYDKIRGVLTQSGAGTKPAQDTLRSNQDLLCFSFSERIKRHIVTLTAVTATVEGACKHCWALYHEDSRTGDIAIPMLFWHALANIISTTHVFNAFLDRAWHLTPTRKHFPSKYKPSASAARESHDPHDALAKAPMSTPYQMLKALDDNAKKIQYALRHTNDPQEISKLTHAHVKVFGAMTVLRERVEHEHQKALAAVNRETLKAGNIAK